MTPPLKYLTKCRVCGQEFTSSALDVPIIGKPNDRVIKFVTALFGHIQAKHPNETGAIFGGIQEYTGLLVLSMFQWQDPQLAGMHENIRGTIHRFTTRYTLSDEEIQGKVEELTRMLDLDPEELEGFRVLMQDMRDLLLEQGRHAPVQPTDKPMVTA